MLLNPYQCYSFVKKEGKHYFYTVYPLSVDPPTNENAFSEFKKDIIPQTVEMEGGKIEDVDLHHTTIISKYRNTRRSNNKKNRSTKKNKKPKKLSEMEHFRARMRMPIGTSSIGLPLTPEMIAINERYAKKIDQRIKDDYYS